MSIWKRIRQLSMPMKCAWCGKVTRHVMQTTGKWRCSECGDE